MTGGMPRCGQASGLSIVRVPVAGRCTVNCPSPGARRRSELAPDIDVDLGLDFLAGPLYGHLTISRTSTDDGFLDRLAAKLVAALGVWSIP